MIGTHEGNKCFEFIALVLLKQCTYILDNFPTRLIQESMLTDLIIPNTGVVPAEKVQQHREIWGTFAKAIASAKKIKKDNPATGIGGTFIQAATALKWLLSADAYFWLQQVGAGPVVPKTLQRINYAKLYVAIVEAAKQSLGGLAWLQSTDFDELDQLVREANTYFKVSSVVNA